MSALLGRHALITGGGRGIGAAVARALAAAGASVVVAARTGKEVEGVAAALRAEGLVARAALCDVTSEESVALLARELEVGGAPSVLVNNAGAAESAPLARTPLALWNRMLAANATGAFLCTRAFLPGMMERGWGRVVNVASVAGLRGERYISAYAASKHALVGLTRSLAAEVAGKGVTVNAVCPGYVDTSLTDNRWTRVGERTGRSREQAWAAVLAAAGQERLVRPEEVAWAVLSLCAEEAGGVNGTTLVVDGGALRA